MSLLTEFKKPIVFCLIFGIMWTANPTIVFSNPEHTPGEACEACIARGYISEECAAEEAQETPAYTRFRTTANLRLRTGPSLYYDIIRTVPNGSIILVYDQRDGEWFAVSQNGTPGYMYAEFLVPAPAPSPTDIAMVSIDAPQETAVNIYGVERVYWSEARNNIIRTGVPLHITDTRTGITFWLESFSNGSHADVVPRTREDTDALRRAFGGRWSWEPRPILVTVDNRTFAASISGMPHGSFNSFDNGMVGHICMHFPGSRTHNGNRSHEQDHQNAVQEAFRAGR